MTSVFLTETPSPPQRRRAEMVQLAASHFNGFVAVIANAAGDNHNDDG